MRLPRGWVSPELASETSSHALFRARARAKRGKPGRAVMIKVGKRDRSTLHHEARALEALRGPGVVELVEVTPGAIVLELVRGPTLEARLARAPLGPREVTLLADALGAILDRIHDAGWVFGDLKPENVILRRGRVSDPVLVDFETAVRAGEPWVPRVTTAYASPERLVGASVADRRSDLFALGAILHAAAEGASPFDASSRDGAVLRVLALEPRRVTSTSPDLAERIEALLRKEPALRPASYAELRARARGAVKARSPHAPGLPLLGASSLTPIHRPLRLEGERAEETLLAFAFDASVRHALLLHVEASERPYGSIAGHVLRLLGLGEAPSFAAVLAAATRVLARSGPRESGRAALVLADVLAGESDAASRSMTDALRADPELLRVRRREAFLALLRRQPRARTVVTAIAPPDPESAAILTAYLNGTTGTRVVFAAGALDLEAERIETGAEAPVGPVTDAALAVAALWGQIFDARDLGELAGIAVGPAEASIVRGIAAGLLVADPFGRGFRFRSRALASAIAATLDDAARAAVARPLAWLVARKFPQEEARIARAFAASGEPLRAAYYAWRGAARALELSDHRAAAPLVALGDEMLVQIGGSIRSLVGAMLDLVRAGVHRFAGDHRAAGLAARRALAFLPSGTRAFCEALGERATAAGRLGDPAEVIAVASALRADPAPEATFAWDRACSRAAVQLFYLGKDKEARELVRLFRARTVDERGRPDPRRRGLSPGCLVTESLYDGRIDEHLVLLGQAIKVFESLGDWRSACLYGSAVGFALGLVGEFARAERVLRETLAKADRTSAAAALRVIALHNLGEIVSHRPGRLDEAIAIESDAIATLRVQGDNRLLVGSLLYRARMLVSRRELDAAERDVREALVHESAFPSIAPWLFATLSLVLLEQDRPHEALASAERAAGFGPTREVSPALLAIVTARSLAAHGRDAEARSVLRKTHREITRRAAKIADPRLRRGFLEKVADHAELARRARW